MRVVPARLLAFALSSLAVFAGGTAIAPTPVTVTVAKAASGHVGGGFAGFSYEKDRVGAGLFDAKDTDLVQLFRRLGPSVLRLGGNLGDQVNWNAGGKGGSATEVAPADVAKLAGFVRAAGWKVIYGINLKTNTPANAASEAQFAAHALGGSLIAFEIGNEPNVYDSETAYETAFDAYVAAIRAKVPNATFDGPGEADKTDWSTTFAAHEKANGLSLLSTHLYIASNTTATIPGMLASNSSGRLPTNEAAMEKAITDNGLAHWRITESNSYFHGGAAGVSNVQAAALWSLDYMHGIAANHGDGVNFHGGTSIQFPLAYSPIVFDGMTPTGVQGVYYGELLWALAGRGSLHAATVAGGSNVTAWGIGTNVFVNNTGTSAVHATVTLAAPAARASEYVLTAPSLDSTAITIAGSAVGKNGAFTPKPQHVTVRDGSVTIDVPAGSAALVVTG
ncbi:glycosyl hydrolase family 79 C-terminal domain-containing protein [Kutzneria buriramensis]|uniref:Glycosyl hydrolase family 79 n=1 Tax=Kutzneria buriramensis TaxID=1045776 RepID=A0A3E0H7U0_9PSEU|nr:glycosyl hydrolase family 79 C-terminal domain-containing protein [Kutzneria buriramensis]REH39492.1 glycosyl hydrolase family 79 [Kutzneria buriramensis]